MSLPEPGQEFEGKYLVTQHIGSGGFAEVFRATDNDSGSEVAIKILVPLHAEWAQNDPIVERFEREGRLLGQLKNEHTVSMIEMGRTADGVSPYIVFEYVDGQDLSQILERQGPLPEERVVTILRQVCSALGEAHALGVMHRDIKPANIMVYEHMGIGGNVKLLDFGIAKPTEGLESKGDLTSAGMVLGTPRYMAPEQFTGARAAPPSDVYSLGLVAFELVTGTMAVDAETTTGIFRQQLSPVEFKIPRTSKISPGLRRVIEKMTRKTRAERYSSVAEVLHDLQNLDRVEAPKVSRKVSKRNRLGIALAVVMTLLALAVGATLALSGSADEKVRLTPLEPPPEPEKIVRLEPSKAHGATTPTRTTTPTPSSTPPAHASEMIPRGRIPRDADGNPLPPPEDEIVPLQLSSAAKAKSVATRALTMGNWEKVIAACKPYADEMTFCARWLADAYRTRGNRDAACYWFEVVGEPKTGLGCAYESAAEQAAQNP